MCGTCHTADLGVHFTRGCSLKPRPHQRQCRQNRRNRQHCVFGDNVAGFGDNVAVFGDIVAGVDGAIGEVVGESELEELVPE